MIELTYRELDRANRTGAFQALLQAKKPIRMKVALRSLPEAFDREYEKLDTMRRELAVENGGTPNKETNIFEFGPDDQIKMNKALAELLDQKIKLPCDPVPFAQLQEADGTVEAPKQWEPNEVILGALSPFLDFAGF